MGAGRGGSCRREAGCVYLLSGGTSSDSSFLVDASADGNDVFIATRAQLQPQDRNEEFDLYDARVGGVQPPSSPDCSDCQGVAPAPPSFATPSSAAFSGAGNLSPAVKPPVTSRAKPKSCRKGFVKRHSRCVKKKTAKRPHRKKAAKTAKGRK